MEGDDRRRNILIIGGLVLVLLLSVVAVYFAFFHEPSDIEPPTFGEQSGERAGQSEDDTLNNRASRENWETTPPRLVQITEEPVSGATTYLDDQDEPILRYAERHTSHIYDVDYETYDDERVSNETLPRVHEALFANDGNNVIFRYLSEGNDTIRTYAAEIVEREGELREGQSTYTIDGEFLPENIPELVVSPGGNELFWLSGSLRDTTGYRSGLTGENSEAIFTSDFTEWIPQWVDGNTIALTTKASGHVNGHSYTFAPSSGALVKRAEVPTVTGLTTLTNPDGTYVLYSEGSDEGLERNGMVNTETEEQTTLFIRTLTEKCAWDPVETHILYCGVPSSAPAGVYPDLWYQGRVLFTDSIWEINAETGDTQEIYDPRQQDRATLDIHRPFVSEDGEYLIFNNKHDMSLWSFRINETVTETVPEGESGI